LKGQELTRIIAGVDFEEAGEKWRGGDAAKASENISIT